MATKVASLYVEVTAKTEGLTRGLSQAKSEITSTGSALSSFSSMAIKSLAAVGAAAVVMSKAFELGEMGSHVLQAQQSFEGLLDTIGGAPDTLQQMRDASRGTIDDMTLMGQAASFLSGQTGELGKNFADALPELTAIATAAAVLNPALGSAADAFTRLSQGIKKAEPELLDELSLYMNLTQVYKAYGDQVGKSAQDLTKAEKSQAMLNEVLRQGNTLIEQAAAVVNPYAQSIDQMQTATTNASNAIATKFAPAVAAAADAVTFMMTPVSQVTDDLSRQASAATLASTSYTEYRAAVDKAAEAAGFFVDESGNLVKSVAYQSGVLDVVIKANYALTDSQYAAVKAAGALGEAVGADANEMVRLSTTTSDTTEAMGQSEQAIQATTDRMNAMAEASEDLKKRQENLQIVTVALAAGIEGQLGKATTSYGETITTLKTQHDDLTASLQNLTDQGYSPLSTKVQEVTAALAQNEQQQGEALTALQGFTAELIYNQAAVGLDSMAALGLARSMGVLSEADYAVAASLQTLRLNFDMNGDGMISAGEGAAQYAAQVMQVTEAVQSLQAKGLPVTIENIASEMKTLGKTGAPQAMETLGTATEDVADSLSGVAGQIRDTSGAAEDAGRTVGELTTAIADTPNQITVTVSTRGIETAISALGRLRTAAEQVPTSIVIHAAVMDDGGGGSGTGPSGGGGSGEEFYDTLPTGKQASRMTVNETYNVYDPIAGAILAAAKRRETARRLEALMNYGN